MMIAIFESPLLALFHCKGLFKATPDPQQVLGFAQSLVTCSGKKKHCDVGFLDVLGMTA